ncbi:MAG TPA: OmpA family protein [Myxococcaceae bacterium]|nr:OmpA family protein [Myxococcaceae bacterium]
MDKRLIGAFLTAACAAGCVTEGPPKELIDARATYQKVASGPAAELNPAGVADAKTALGRAEKSYEDHKYDVSRSGDFTRDEAYVAMRKAQLAESEANLVLASREKAKLDRDLEAAKLARAQRDAAAAGNTDDVAQRLANIASVKQEARGTVLTLAGNVLFATGQYKLRDDSLPALKQVVGALRDMGGKTFIVEGYTDSTGSDTVNRKLSMKRATSVQQYLIRQGIPADQIKAVGNGKDRPIASNDTPEGRAQNRRVEIIVTSNPS